MSMTRPRRRRFGRRAVVLSLIVHVVVIAALARYTIFTPKRPDRLTDAPGTTIVLATPAAPEPMSEPAAPVETIPVEPPPAAPVVEPPPPPPPAPTMMMTPSPARLPASLGSQAKAPPKPDAPKPAPVTPPPLPPSPTEHVAVSFAGVDAPAASRIVYAMDGSAAMISTFPFVKEQLVRSVSRLGPAQTFQVVVFRRPPMSDGRPTRPEVETFATAGSYEGAGSASVERLRVWLTGIRPGGGSSPIVGLTAAMQHKPDLVFLMTCSIPRTGTAQWGGGKEAILASLEELNPVGVLSRQRPAVIKSIQFLDADPTGILEAIARAHGDGPGSYRVLRLNELASVDPR